MTLRVGQLIYGFCQGIFGRDHYGRWRVEALGYDWIVVRDMDGDGYADAVDFHATPGRPIENEFEPQDFQVPVSTE